MMTEKRTESWVPPYTAFRNLLNLLERLEANMPPRIDRSFLTGSGAVNTQTLKALRSLGLIDEGGVVQPRLIELATNPEDRPALIARMVEHFYPKPVALGKVNATQKQLEESFDDMEVTGDTRRKAIAFFLKAADYGKLTLSPYFKTPSSRGSGSGPRKQTSRKTTKREKIETGEAGEGGKDRSTGGAGPQLDSLKMRYIEMLMKKAEGSDGLDAELLNRIETLLGFTEGAT
jgi:hypothetical protein